MNKKAPLTLNKGCLRVELGSTNPTQIPELKTISWILSYQALKLALMVRKNELGEEEKSCSQQREEQGKFEEREKFDQAFIMLPSQSQSETLTLGILWLAHAWWVIQARWPTCWLPLSTLMVPTPHWKLSRFACNYSGLSFSSLPSLYGRVFQN